MPSPCGVGGETGHTGQEDLEPINSHSVGAGGMTGACSSAPASKTPLVLSAFSSLGCHKTFKK